MLNEIKRILQVSGFDNCLSILALKPSDIPDIEKCVNQNKNILKNSNQNSVTEDFTLKPGHRALILNLPEKFKAYCDSLSDLNELASKSDETSESRSEENKVIKDLDKNKLISLLLAKLENYLKEFNYINLKSFKS